MLHEIRRWLPLLHAVKNINSCGVTWRKKKGIDNNVKRKQNIVIIAEKSDCKAERVTDHDRTKTSKNYLTPPTTSIENRTLYIAEKSDDCGEGNKS